jgi:hypothetical protein
MLTPQGGWVMPVTAPLWQKPETGLSTGSGPWKA